MTQSTVGNLRKFLFNLSLVLVYVLPVLDRPKIKSKMKCTKFTVNFLLVIMTGVLLIFHFDGHCHLTCTNVFTQICGCVE